MNSEYKPKDAEEALNALGLDIFSDQEIADWNATRNDGGMPQSEIQLEGWVEDTMCLSKEIYVRDAEGVGVYCRALYCEWEGQDEPSIVLDDYDGNEFRI